MPLSNEDLGPVRRQLYEMVRDTLRTVVLIRENTDRLFGANSGQVREAIDEYFTDFVNPSTVAAAGQKVPEDIIFSAPLGALQRAGLYGAQLRLKSRHVTEANVGLRGALGASSLGGFRNPFKKWIDCINNFLRSLIAATGFGESLMELKDSIRDDLPEEP